MMLAKNSLSHLYDEGKSRQMYKEIEDTYIKLLKKTD